MKPFMPYKGFPLKLKQQLKRQGKKLHRRDLEDYFLLYSYNVILSSLAMEPRAKPLWMAMGQASKPYLLKTLQTTQDDLPDWKVDYARKTHIFEAIHYLTTHQVLYVKTALAERLINSNMAVEYDRLKLPFNIFEVCFQEDLHLIPNKPTPSCIAALMPDRAVKDANETYIHRLGKTTGLTDCINAFETIAGNYLAPTTHLALYVFWNADNENAEDFFMSFPLSEFKGKTFDEAIDSSLEVQNYNPKSQFTIDESRTLFLHYMKVIFGLLCYLNTQEPDIKAFKYENRPSFGECVPQEYLLGGSMERTPPHWHIRKGHFRHLRHERYSRDEEGDVRCIWINPMEINPDGKALSPNPKIEVPE